MTSDAVIAASLSEPAADAPPTPAGLPPVIEGSTLRERFFRAASWTLLAYVASQGLRLVSNKRPG